MSKLSKTARASMGQQAPKEVKVIPDAELIRLLRIDRASGIFATCQGADAALRRITELEGLLAASQLNVIQLNASLPLKDQVTGTVEFVNEKSEVVATGVTIGLPYLNTPGDLDATNGELPAAQ